LCQKRDLSVQEHTTEFRCLAMALEISMDSHEILMKYTSGLLLYINTKMLFYDPNSVSNISTIAMIVGKKNGHGKSPDGLGSGSSKQKNFKKIISSPSSLSTIPSAQRYCDYYKI